MTVAEAERPMNIWQAWCEMCGHRWVAVAPEGTDLTALECSVCGAQSSVAVAPKD